jgi:hypothetical protein
MADEIKIIPEEFSKVIRDFVCDLRITFPEYGGFIDKWWKSRDHFNYIDEEEERNVAYDKAEKQSMHILFNFCRKKLPPRFFDILYQNEEIFKEDSEVDTEFFPNIHFKNLWQSNISDKTKGTIWKYLQLVLFSIVGTLDNKDSFGDTAKLFETINQDDFKTKLQDTLGQMQGLFDTSVNDISGNSFSEKTHDLPNADQINDHISEMLDGKLGQIAREIAEETAANLNMDFEGATDMKDVFNTLVQNPTKLTGLIKTVGEKIDAKFKSGELNETEMLKEASELMNKMKNMPGMGNIQSMLNKMGMGGLGKVNTAAMEAKLNQNLKLATTKDRIRAKAEANAKAKALAAASAVKSETSIKVNPLTTNTVLTDEEIIKIFGSGEKDKVERTPRGSKPQPSTTSTSSNNNKKKKGKK